MPIISLNINRYPMGLNNGGILKRCFQLFRSLISLYNDNFNVMLFKNLYAYKKKA